MNGKIELTYDNCSGTFIVSNASNPRNTEVPEFLEANRKHFGKMADRNNWSLMYWIDAGRVGKFKLYARSKGFEVVMGR